MSNDSNVHCSPMATAKIVVRQHLIDSRSSHFLLICLSDLPAFRWAYRWLTKTKTLFRNECNDLHESTWIRSVEKRLYWVHCWSASGPASVRSGTQNFESKFGSKMETFHWKATCLEDGIPNSNVKAKSLKLERAFELSGAWNIFRAWKFQVETQVQTVQWLDFNYWQNWQFFRKIWLVAVYWTGYHWHFIHWYN